MSGDLANLFEAAGCTADTMEARASDAFANVCATPAALHPAQLLQDAYLESFVLFAKLQSDLAHAESVSGTVGFYLRNSRLDIDWSELSKSAVHRTVEVFRQRALADRAALDPGEEFERAFGKGLYETLQDDDEQRRRRRRQSIREDGEEDDKEPEPVRVDLLRLWDSLMSTYADGGVTLARTQAAKAILDNWSLRDKPFEVKNGKAVIEDRVYSEVHYSGQPRTVSYSHRENLYALFKGLQVWFDWADINANAMTTLFKMQTRGAHDIVIEMGASYTVAAGQVQVRTFKEHWRWTLEASAAEKLREFIVAYGVVRET
jgi:hypothetical protein